MNSLIYYLIKYRFKITYILNRYFITIYDISIIVVYDKLT